MTRPRAAIALAVALAALGGFAAALALPAGRSEGIPPSALAVELSAQLSRHGQPMLVGSVPAIADRIELRIGDTRAIVSLRRHGEVDGTRRSVAVPLPADGPWEADVWWAEHRLGGAGGGPVEPPPAAGQDQG